MDSDTRYEFNEIKDHLNEQNIKLAAYNSSLEKHMYRTDLLEAGLIAQKEHFEFRHDAIEKMIEKRDAAFNNIPTKILQYVSILAGLIGLFKLTF